MRHLFGTGLSQQQVEETLAEAARLVACGGNVAGWFGGLVQIEGHSIVYEPFLKPLTKLRSKETVIRVAV